MKELLIGVCCIAIAAGILFRMDRRLNRLPPRFGVNVAAATPCREAPRGTLLAARAGSNGLTANSYMLDGTDSLVAQVTNRPSTVSTHEFKGRWQSIAGGDVDSDGLPDIAVARLDGGQVSLEVFASGGSIANSVSVPAAAAAGSSVQAVLIDSGATGRAELSIYYRESGIWEFFPQALLSTPAANPAEKLTLRTPADGIPLAANVLGGCSEEAIVWYLNPQSAAPAFAIYDLRNGSLLAEQQFGLTGDLPIAADQNCDGREELAVFRPSTGIWYILPTSGEIFEREYSIAFGVPGAFPLTGDFDADGCGDLAFGRQLGTRLEYRIRPSRYAEPAFGLFPAGAALEGRVVWSGRQIPLQLWHAASADSR